MDTKKGKLPPKEIRILKELGENIKLARLRRKLTMEQVSERANIGRSTLWHVEKGSPHIGIGIVLRVLSVLGLSKDLQKVGANDILGKKLQDVDLTIKKRAPKKKKK